MLWVITGQGNLAIAFATVAELAAGVLTIIKSWASPGSETPWTYLASGVGASITLVTLVIGLIIWA